MLGRDFERGAERELAWTGHLEGEAQRQGIETDRAVEVRSAGGGGGRRRTDVLRAGRAGA